MNNFSCLLHMRRKITTLVKKMLLAVYYSNAVSDVRRVYSFQLKDVLAVKNAITVTKYRQKTFAYDRMNFTTVWSLRKVFN